MILEYNGKNFIESGLLYFYSNYSSKCNIFLDAINRIFSKTQCDVLKINITKFPELKRRYSVTKLPEFIIIKDSNVISKISGVIDSYSLEKWVNKYI